MHPAGPPMYQLSDNSSGGSYPPPPSSKPAPRTRFQDGTAESTGVRRAGGGAGGGGMGRSDTFWGARPNRNTLAPGAGFDGGRKLTRGKTLTRPERHVQAAPLINPGSAPGAGAGTSGPQSRLPGLVTSQNPDPYQEQAAWYNPWNLFAHLCTWWAPPFVCSWFGLHDKPTRQAWREKIALCMIALFMGGFVAFVTIGLNRVLCPDKESEKTSLFIRLGSEEGLVGIHGYMFDATKSKPADGADFQKIADDSSGQDITNMFDRSKDEFPECDGINGKFATLNFCEADTGTISTEDEKPCVLKGLGVEQSSFDQLGLENTTKLTGWDWDQIVAMKDYFVLDGNVLNMAPYMSAFPDPIPDDNVDAAIRFALRTMDPSSGKDATRSFYHNGVLKEAIPCLSSRYYAGHIDKLTPGCFVSQIFLYLSLIIIMAIVLSRFAMACIFNWFLSERLVKPPKNLKKNVVSPAVMPEGANMDVGNKNGAAPWATPERTKTLHKSRRGGRGGGRGGAGGLSRGEKGLNEKGDLSPPVSDSVMPLDNNGMISMAAIGSELFCVALVTCYSEGEEGIKNTLDSISGTEYSDGRKLLFVVCDGMITGSGETRSTPDTVVSMIEPDPRFVDPQPMSYFAVASGKKAHNQAMIYAGHYTKSKGHRTPIVVIVKCGPPEESSEKKPGNRGKRDSQMILMNFFSRVTYNDRMTPLDYDLFRKTTALMGVTPDFFEVCLMVDADTKVYPNALKQLVNCCQHDPMIMGVCGETRISNKRQSWVTAIQVFEYFISHHLAKGFESVFGGVTCLPGCFSMYRLKARKSNDGDWVPVLVQPQICSEYSQSIVTTLHQKNLLLLGEDRFLTTLMIRTFPNRKMMFCPQARCRTIAPDEFKVLLSQRRRWINSTVHNLMELCLVRNLCGTFCFSMQFVVFMELCGTVVLPVAITLTYVLIVNYFLNPPKNFSDAIPIMLLVGVLGLPAILILLTTRKVIYIAWMIIYLIALPVWNFILPVYSFWHFDDFSWGETRKVEGEGKDKGHGGGDDKLDPNAVPLRRWEDYERTRLRKIKREEKRRREFEKAFGTAQVHDPNKLGGDNWEDGSSRMDSETMSMTSYEDRWGNFIPTYQNEDGPGTGPPPVGLYDIDEASVHGGDTMGGDQLHLVLEGGWDDEPPTPKRSQPYSHGNDEPVVTSWGDHPLASPVNLQHADNGYPIAPSPMIPEGQYTRDGQPPRVGSGGYGASSGVEGPGHAKKRSVTGYPSGSDYGWDQGSNASFSPRSPSPGAGGGYGGAGRRLI